MRLRQSLAKILISKCPAIALKRLEEGMDETNPMRKGSLLDQLVFQQPNYHVVVARVKPKKKGELGRVATDWKCAEAKAERTAARSRGQVACFQHELEAAQRLAGCVRARLLEAGAELRDDSCPRQMHIEWETDDGTPAEGTPDLIILHGQIDAPTRVDTVDLKRTDANPEWLDRHVDDQHWDMQGHAYQEAVHRRWLSAEGRGRHWILAADDSGDDCQLYPLGERFAVTGRSKWRRAQVLFERCVATGEWPFYKARELNPPDYAFKKEMERGQ